MSTKKIFLSFVFVSMFFSNSFVFPMQSIVQGHVCEDGPIDPIRVTPCLSEEQEEKGEIDDEDALVLFSETQQEQPKTKKVSVNKVRCRNIVPNKNLAIIRLLVKEGFDPRTKNEEGMNALHCAVLSGNFEAVRFFIDECGMDLLEKDGRGRTSIDLARLCEEKRLRGESGKKKISKRSKKPLADAQSAKKRITKKGKLKQQDNKKRKKRVVVGPKKIIGGRRKVVETEIGEKKIKSSCFPRIIKDENFNDIEYRQIKTVDQGKWEVDGTCASQAIRNAKLICEFFESGDAEKLELIKDDEDAQGFLEGLEESGGSLSWLHGTQVEEMVEGLRLSQKITVLDSVFDADGIVSGSKRVKIDTIKTNFRDVDLENYFHVFIIGADDFSKFLAPTIEEFEKQQNCTVSMHKRDKLLAREEGGNHWYVAAISKQGDSTICFVIDTFSPNNHIANRTLLARNRYLCQSLIKGRIFAEFGDRIRRSVGRKVRRAFKKKRKKRSRSDSDSEDDSEDVEAIPADLEDFIDIPEVLDPIFARLIYNSVPRRIQVAIRRYNSKGVLDVPNRPILLHGPYGTGKTTIAQLIGDMTNRRVYVVDSPSLGTKYRNSEEENLGNVMRYIRSRKEPCVVVFDEVTALTAPRKNDGGEKIDEKLATMLNKNLKNPNIYIVWTTNNYDGVTSRFLSRISPKVKIDLPNEMARENLLKNLVGEPIERLKQTEESIARKMNFEDPLNCHRIAEMTGGFSCRDLEILVENCREEKGDDSDLEGDSDDLIEDSSVLLITRDTFNGVYEEMMTGICQEESFPRQAWEWLRANGVTLAQIGINVASLVDGHMARSRADERIRAEQERAKRERESYYTRGKDWLEIGATFAGMVASIYGIYRNYKGK